MYQESLTPPSFGSALRFTTNFDKDRTEKRLRLSQQALFHGQTGWQYGYSQGQGLREDKSRQ
jgi:hypothetical protein